LVLVDLKIGKLTPADIAQMKLYLNWARRYDRQEGENDPIGLILCGSQNEQVVELLLTDPVDSIDERIKVSRYLLLDSQDALKRETRGKQPVRSARAERDWALHNARRG
jgi:hypothetical protein